MLLWHSRLPLYDDRNDHRMMTDPQAKTENSGGQSPEGLCPSLRQGQTPPRRKKRWYLLGGLTGATVALVGSGYYYGQYFVQTQIAPLVSQGLGHFLNRPVQIGPVQSVSWSSIRFGPSALGATPQDPDRVTMAGLEITFNPWDYLSQRQLFLQATAIQPQAYVEQGQKGEWLRTPVAPIHPDFPIHLQTLTLKQAEITLVTRNVQGKLQPAVPVFLEQGFLDFRELSTRQRLPFALKGQLARQGELVLKGVWEPHPQNFTLALRGHDLAAIAVTQLLPLPLPLTQGTLSANLEVTIRQQRLTAVQGVAQVQGVKTHLAVLPKPLTQIQGPLRFRGTTIFLEQVTGKLGPLSAQAIGQFDWQKGYDLTLNAPRLALTDISKTLPTPLAPFPLQGEVTGQLRVKGSLTHPQITATLQNHSPLQIERFRLSRLTAALALDHQNIRIQQLQADLVDGGHLEAIGTLLGQKKQQTLSLIGFTGTLRGQGFDLQQLARYYPVSFPFGSTSISGQTQLLANWSNPQKALHFRLQTGQGEIHTAGGQIRLRDFSYQDGFWQGKAHLQGLKMNQLMEQVPLFAGVDYRLKRGQLQGDLSLQGYQTDLDQLQAQGNLRWQTQTGQITAQKVVLDQQKWRANLQTQNLPLKPWLATLPTPVQLTSRLAVQGNLRNFQQSLQINGTATLNLPQGQIQVSQLRVQDRQWTAQLIPQRLALNPFYPQLRGKLQGQLQIQGQGLQTLSLQKIAGQLRFSEGLGYLRQAMKTDFHWQGNQFWLKTLQTPNLQANGFLQIPLRSLQTPQTLAQNLTQKIEAIQLNLQAQNLPLADLLPLSPAPPVSRPPLTGRLDFTGQLRGNLQNPQVIGKLGLQHLALGGQEIAPRLTGSVRKNAQGLLLQLQGLDTLFQITLDPQNQPLNILWQQPQSRISGTREGQEFWLMGQGIPLDFLQSVANLGGQYFDQPQLIQASQYPLTGRVSGQLGWHFGHGTGRGQLTLERPSFQTLALDRITTQLTFADNRGSATPPFLRVQGQLHKGKNRYPFQGQALLDAAQPQLEGELVLPQTPVQELLTLLHIFRFDDLDRTLKRQLPVYAKAADLYSADQSPSQPLTSVGSLDRPTNVQIGEGLAIRDRQGQQQIQRQKMLPELADLTGELGGKLTVKGSLGGDWGFGFDLLGKDWQWGPLAWERLTVRGQWQKETLTLNPLRLEGKQGLIALSGVLSPTGQEAELTLQNLPLALLPQLVQTQDWLTPGGQLNGAIALSGSRGNPRAKGKLWIEQALLNRLPLTAVTGNFDYQQGRLNFALESILQAKTDPLTLKGSLPYVLPLATVLPDSPDFQVSLQIKNDNLKILNLLSNQQLNWQGGQGQIQAQMTGQLDPRTLQIKTLKTEGFVTIKDATIAAQVLPKEPLTEVNGTMTLDLNHLSIQSLTGRFSGGDLAIAGDLPFGDNRFRAEQPLRLSLNNLRIKLPNLYEGNLQGDIQLGGTLTAPILRGNLNLSQGEILLGEGLPSLGNPQTATGQIEFQQFRLGLGPEIRITRSPILDFLAQGSLVLNGNLGNPQPDGIIYLKAGQINLFASQLRLAGGDENRALFTPARGLDPFLQLQLVSTATESDRRLMASPTSPSEIADPFTANRESLQTVRITANIRGHGSDLTTPDLTNRAIQLTSVPRRSQREIISLLGGSFIDTFAQGEATLGLANLASAAVLGTVQNRLGDTLGLSQFRIFSTPLINPEERIQSSQMGVAAEAGIDLTHDLTLSVQKIFNADRPPQWGLNYRFNESWRVRGSSNFAEDSRGVVEFEQRF